MAALVKTSSQRGRKRTKTFTGCWTCRSRKVKCDEGRPFCSVCREKKLLCEGYDARLQWLPPEANPFSTSSSSSSSSSSSELGGCVQPSTDSCRSRSLRRHMPAAPQGDVLSWSQVEEILNAVDLLEQGWDPKSRGELSLNIRNFGIFGLPQSGDSAERRRASLATESPSINSEAPKGPDAGAENPPDPELDGQLRGDIPVESCQSPIAVFRSDEPIDGLGEGATNLDDAANHSTQSRSYTPPLTAIWSSFDSDTSLHFADQSEAGEPTSATGFFGDILSILTPDSQEPAAPTRVSPPLPEPHLASELERHLMYNYSQHVVNIFCVVDNAKSPWKTIHLPRAMQCVGELSLHGSTSRVRKALRNALLSISGFFLSNKHKTGHCHSQARYWHEIASSYRFSAIGLLKSSVESDLYSEARPKYKEILATMLSMVSINVISGDTNSCRVHLDGASRLIEHMSRRKKQYSGKARALHRTYLYLRVIYESTASREYPNAVSPFPFPSDLPFLADSLAAGNKAIDGGGRFSMPSAAITQENEPSYPQQQQQQQQRPSDVTSSFECIYGIPLCLLKLLEATINVIDQIDAALVTSCGLILDDDLSNSCDQLEQAILDWPSQNKPRSVCASGAAADDSKAEIIQYQTQAFHNALIIYFSQNVRRLSYRYLRQYVENILQAIEAIEELKEETRMLLAAPLFWPVFIGATEAFDQGQQDRFRAWYVNAEKYGIAAMRTGITVIHRIWRQGSSSRAGGGVRPGTWRQLLRETGDILMLT